MKTLFVEHLQHGLGAVTDVVHGDTVRVQFASGRLFNLPFDSLRVLRALEGDLRKRRTRAERAFIKKHSKHESSAVTLKPSRGLPGETVSQRLVRRFLIGLLRQNKGEQKIAFAGLRTIAAKAGRGLDEFLPASTAAAEVLAEWLRLNRGDPRWFGKLCREKALMERRKQTAVKRGRNAKQIRIEPRTQEERLGWVLGKEAEKKYFGGRRKRKAFLQIGSSEERNLLPLYRRKETL
jgi:hypothetical protein